MPLSYNTFVGERGSNLSGGQRQRIAIARMILNNPKLIILDEATSSLDLITEKKVIENLLERYKDITILFISHRIKSMKNADQIFVINRGRIEEKGTHKNLLDFKGRYSILMKEEKS